MRRRVALFAAMAAAFSVWLLPATARAQGDADAGAPPAASPPAATTPPAAGANAAPSDPAKADPEATPAKLDLLRLKVSGYILPLFLYSQRDSAVARDRIQLGMASSTAGVVLLGTPYEDWSYRIEVNFDATVISNRQASASKVITDVATQESGTGDRTLKATTTFLTSVPVQEASIMYRPAPWYAVKVGRMRMPFSPAQAATVTTTMFPTRPAPTEVFLSGADDGILNTFDLLEGRFQAHVGAFNGGSLGLRVVNTTPLGPVYSLFLDAHPLGRMPGREGGAVRGPLRLGVGLGVLYRIGTLFDDTGYEATRFADARLSGALRASFYGVFLQGEILRRVQTDNLSLRPAIATGVYGQGSYYHPLGRVALGPLARIGYSVQSENFAPQQTLSYEGGIAFYPKATIPEPDALRIIVQYVGETRTPSEESANGVLAQLQLKF